MPDRGEALLDGRRGSLAAELLDVGRDVQRLHVGDRGDAGALAPGQKFPRRLRVGAARVLVADVGGEEFEEADLRALAGGDDGAGTCAETERAGSWLAAINWASCAAGSGCAGALGAKGFSSSVRAFARATRIDPMRKSVKRTPVKKPECREGGDELLVLLSKTRSQTVPARQSLLKIGLRKGPGRVVMDIPDRGFEHLPNDIKLVVEVVVTAVGDLVCVPLDEEYFPCRSCDDGKQTQGLNLAAVRPPACISFPPRHRLLRIR